MNGARSVSVSVLHAPSKKWLRHFDAGTYFLVPRSFDFGDTTRRLQVEQRPGEGETLLFRQANCLKGQFFDAGHVCRIVWRVGGSMAGSQSAFPVLRLAAQHPRKLIVVIHCMMNGEAAATATSQVTSC
jgi:hypothetical protein